MKRNSPRVLLAAYQCGPGMGSVSQIGWEWYSRLAQRLPVTLVTHVRNRKALESAGAPIEDSQIVYIDTEWFAGPLYRFAKWLFPYSEHSVFLVSSVDFFLYDWLALRKLKGLAKLGQCWQLVHAATPVSNMAPTLLHKLGVPLVVGPLNAGLGLPPGCKDLLKKDSTWLYPIRNFGKLVDLIVGSTRNATKILTATQATRRSIGARYQSRCIEMLENGIDLKRFVATPWPEPPSASSPLRILFVGRLVPFKALSLLLKAVQKLKKDHPVELTVVGEGSMLGEWRQEAVKLGIGDLVVFKGPQSLDQVAIEMQRAHVFCLPSIRESGGAVLLEAMASARPCVAIDFGGPAEIVDSTTGCLIRPTDPEGMINGLAAALGSVFRNPEKWKARGIAGRNKAEAEFDWDAKVEKAISYYQKILNAQEGITNRVASFAH